MRLDFIRCLPKFVPLFGLCNEDENLQDGTAYEKSANFLAHSIFQFLKMGKYFGMQVVFACIRQGVACDALQFVQNYKVVPNEKDDILEISIKTAIQFTESDAVWIGNVNFQVPKLSDADTALIASLRQRDKAFDGDGFNMDFQFPGNLHDGSMQFVRVHIVADKVNIYG